MSGHSGTNSSRSRRRGGPPPGLRIAAEVRADGTPPRADSAIVVAPPSELPPPTPEVVALAQATVEARQIRRHEQVARAAYLRAEQRGFAPGHEIEDWLAAEAEVAAAPQDGILAD